MKDGMLESLWATLNTITPIPVNELQDNLSMFKYVALRKNEYFSRSNEVCQRVAFVHKGILRTFSTAKNGDEVTLCFCSENRFSTAFKSFSTQLPSEISIQAVESCELVTLDHSSLLKLYKKSSHWQTIGRVLAEREYLNMETYAISLNQDKAKEKYEKLLKEQPQVIQRVPVHLIASYLGVSRETLSRIRKSAHP